MTQKTAVAYLNAVKSSPIKIMKISRNITGMSVSETLKILQFSKLKISSVVKVLVHSAVANAENNHAMDADNLYVKEVNVGRAFGLRRFSARGRGRSSKILKTFSNIRVILAEKSAGSSDKIKKE